MKQVHARVAVLHLPAREHMLGQATAAATDKHFISQTQQAVIARSHRCRSRHCRCWRRSWRSWRESPPGPLADCSSQRCQTSSSGYHVTSAISSSRVGKQRTHSDLFRVEVERVAQHIRFSFQRRIGEFGDKRRGESSCDLISKLTSRNSQRRQCSLGLLMADQSALVRE